MVKCRDITLVASDYVDGRLRWRKRLAVIIHLIMCAHCRRFMTNFRGVVSVIRGYAPPPPDARQLERFQGAVHSALEHQAHGHRSDD